MSDWIDASEREKWKKVIGDSIRFRGQSLLLDHAAEADRRIAERDRRLRDARVVNATQTQLIDEYKRNLAVRDELIRDLAQMIKSMGSAHSKHCMGYDECRVGQTDYLQLLEAY
jgi:hypothetical protein